MMRSMSSAVSSLKNHQTRMDVIGNNIANVNTVAFKSGRVTFKDTFSENLRTGTGPSENRGGLNPHQVGLGMTLSAIDNAMIKGSIDTTGIGTDVYIDGKGWLQVRASDGVFYTRDGNLRIDEQGNLITQAGHFVQGYQVDEEGNILGTTGNIQVPIKDILDPKVTTEIELEGNLDSRAGDGIDPAKIAWPTGTALTDFYDMTPATPTPGVKTEYRLKPQFEGTADDSQRSLMGSKVPIYAYDSLGKDKHSMQLHFIAAEGPNSNKWHVFAFYDDPVQGMIPAVSATNGGSMGAGVVGPGYSGTIEFTPEGRLAQTSPSSLQYTLAASQITGANDVTFTVDLSKISQFESGNTVNEKKNNGYPLGKLSSYSIAGDGKVLGNYTNGLTKTLGQIVTATFANEDGLQKMGGNLWIPTENSGDPVIGKPGDGGSGMLQSGALEMSNVDLAKEFTNMIITQRGFQANSRVITTTDQMLEELVNLKR